MEAILFRLAEESQRYHSVKKSPENQTVMTYKDLPDRWKEKIKIYLESIGQGHRKQLFTSEFPSQKILKMTFVDGSYAEFKYPLVIDMPEHGEIGVFTEHCGYHVFNRNAFKWTIEDE